MNIALIILAAGNSSRLGKPKQLLRRGDTRMIEHIVSECNQSGLGPVYVVTGAYHNEISQLIGNELLLRNMSWQQGMSSSISFAMRSINTELLDGVMIILSDQVYFDRSVLNTIADVAITKKYKTINCRYQKGMGPPTYFDQSLFAELEQLSGDDGAKLIVRKYVSQSTAIDFPRGDIDLDTEEDLRALKDF